jgi:hypothetical protein
MGLQLESGEGAQILSRILRRYLIILAGDFKKNNASHLQEFLKLAGRIPITLDYTEAQNFMFDLMKEHFPELAARAALDSKALALATQLVEVMEALYFSPVRYMRLLG